MIIFSRQDIARWSFFSGDNNKLHYSPPPAKCIVQGMLVFVYLLDRIEKRHSTNHCAVKTECFFRKSIFTDNAYYLTMPDVNKLIIGCAVQGKSITATTHYTTKRFTEKKRSHTERISIDNESMKKHKINFNKVLPEPKTEYSFYCALCFSAILGSKSFLTYKNITYKTPNEYFENYIVTHVSQTVELIRSTFQKIVITEQSTIDALVTVSQCNDISLTAVARSFIYNLNINGNEVLQMKSLFLIEDNKISKE